MLFWKRKREIPQGAPEARWAGLLAAVAGADSDLMVVVGPEDGGSVCTDWVGAVVSVSGADARFPSLVDAIEDGLFHAGCRHTLIPYRAEDGEAEALFCTKLAVSGMTQRGNDRRAAAAPGAETKGDEPRAQFMRVYDLARNAEKSKQPQIALHYCQEALSVLVQREVFGDDQLMIERVLKGRMQTIFRAHQAPAGGGEAVE